MDIYLDTNLWNALHDQGVVPDEFVRRLGLRNAYLAIGTHDFYELAKTFRKPNPKSQQRGQSLFVYFTKFLEADTHCVKDITGQSLPILVRLG